MLVGWKGLGARLCHGGGGKMRGCGEDSQQLVCGRMCRLALLVVRVFSKGVFLRLKKSEFPLFGWFWCYFFGRLVSVVGNLVA